MSEREDKGSFLKRILERRVDAYALFPLIALVIIIAIWLSTFRVIHVERESAESRAVESALEQIEIYEAQMIRNLGAIDQTLKTIAYMHSLKHVRPVLRELNEYGVIPSRLIFSIEIANRNGLIIEATNTVEQADVSDEAYFQFHRTEDWDWPLVSRLAGDAETEMEERLQFSRRLNGADGDFDGVVMVSVPVDYFTSGYDAARLGHKGVLGLIDKDGHFLVKRSGDEVSSGELAGQEFIDDDQQGFHNLLQQNRWDGVERYTNVRSLYGFPLSVVVGLAQDEQLAAFHQQMRVYWVSALAATLLLVIVAALLTNLSWHLAKGRARVRKDQETYYAASEASLEAVMVWRSVNKARQDDTPIDFVLDSINYRGTHLFGKPKNALLGRSVHDLLPQCSANGFLDALLQVAQSGVIHEHEWENDFPALQAKWLYRKVIRVQDGVVVILRDISERREAEARISHMAHHDALTGLPNRTLLEQKLKQAMQQARLHRQLLAVVFVDLDNFKLVNDGLGHKAGDELLKIVARRMEHCLRSSDTVVRLGGDEFVMLLCGDLEHNNRLTTLLQQVGASIAEPIHLHNQRFEITSSLGVALYPKDGEDSETLLSNADAAMYEAKALGRNNFQFYCADMHARILDKLALQEGLRNAVARDELILLYQPQVDLRSGAIIGAEALLRWQHPAKGMIFPSDFVPLAEENGTILPIGEWVLRTACRQNKAWQEAGLCPLVISVNVSARQFRAISLTAQVRDALQDSGLAPCYLNLEVTESLIMQDAQQAIAIMQELKAMGVQLSIDDFGTGYSSLSSLKSFPITSLKLDRSFVADLCEDKDDEAITKAVIALGHEMDLEVIAEGVETQAQLAFLISSDCDAAQGYYFGEPVSAQEMAGLARLRYRPARRLSAKAH